LKGTGRAYEESLLAVSRVLGIELQEIDDWNCCGATAYMSMSARTSHVLTARNLALAGAGRDAVLAPCSGCYLALKKCQHYVADYPDIAAEVQQSLQRDGLSYRSGVEVRHPLDVLVNDVGLDTIKDRVVRRLTGLKIASYYGCQLIRPYATFDDQQSPQLMDRLFKVLGAEVVTYPLRARCCGGSLTGTVSDVGQRLGFILLKEAQRRGANVMATVCPLCQFNLDAYQGDIGRRYEPVTMPVVYFTQLLGLALGLSEKELGLHRCIVPFDSVLAEQEVAV
jgi:heterodisulfide reductase subunit B